MIFGTYLVIILVSNTFMHKTLYLSGLWKSHFLCFMAFGTLLWFTVLGQLLLTFMSVSRYMIVSYPLDTKFKESLFTMKYILLIYILSFGLSLFITLYFKHIWHSVSIDLCIPFLDPSSSVTLTKLITWFVVISQSVSSIIITIMYILLYRIIKKSKMIIRKSKEHSQIILQIVLITASNYSMLVSY